jgi:cytochrome b561
VTVTLFITLIAIHVTAALKHLLVNRDGVFQRMWRISPDRNPAKS